tara:strand:- start:2157 stop:5084 length:2928 start_codon:yes stop_codon:yes gene_type:complete
MPRKPLFNTKLKVGSQVLWNSNEYFVSDINRNQRFGLKIKNRFQPYRHGTTGVRPCDVVRNTEDFRKNLQSGTWVLYDANTFSIPAVVVRRAIDTVDIQPLHVRHIITISIFSNRITKTDESFANYQLRSCCLTNKYIQALATYRGSSGYVFDYEGIADRYMFIRRNDMACFWVKENELTMQTMNTDPFYGNWDTVGVIEIPFQTLFLELTSSYSSKTLPDPDSLKDDLWFFLHQSNTRCMRSSNKDIDVLVDLLWLEFHWAYWKKEFKPWFLEYDYELYQHQSDTKLLNSISDDCLPYIADRLNRSTHERRRALRVENFITGKKLFQTSVSYHGDNLRVVVRVPELPSLRSAKHSGSFVYDYVCRIMCHLSDLPQIPVLSSGAVDVPMKLPLKPFQRQIVFDMFQREKNPRYVFDIKTKMGRFFNVISGFCHNRKFYGGILGLRTGYGKTICTLALIAGKRVKRTLVVVPLSLMDQWISEVNKFTSLTVSELYNTKRTVQDTDITVTTYGTLSSIYRDSEYNDVFVQFDRVVFDESHTIKTYHCNIANACKAVDAKYRWCLSATPFRKGTFKNISTQMKMLAITPFQTNRSPFHFVNTHYTDLPRTKYVLDAIKDLILQPSLEVEMPKPKEILKAFELNENERALYDVLYHKIKEKIEELYHSETQNYMLIKSLINKLCICANDPYLLPMWEYGDPCESGTVAVNELQNRLNGTTYQKEVKKSLNNLSETSCTLCFETVERPTITPCLHIFCHGCIHRALEYSLKCPVCRSAISKDSLEEIKPKMEEKTKDGNIFVYDIAGGKRKVCRTIVSMYEQKGESKRVQYLKSLLSTRNKVVVFSQFNTVLNFYSSIFSSCIITGRSTRAQRKRNLERFKNGECNLFFLSTNVANVGLNLEEGDTLVFIDPGLDEAQEEQAIGRLLRIGQRNNIEIHRMFTSNTVADNVNKWRSRYNFQQGSHTERKTNFLTYAYRLVH